MSAIRERLYMKSYCINQDLAMSLSILLTSEQDADVISNIYLPQGDTIIELELVN